MRPASDYLTLLQLAVGLNLLVGAYSSYRKGVEAAVEDELDLHRERINEIVATSSKLAREIEHNLENKPIKTLTDQKLSGHLGDISIKFHQRA